MDENVLKSEPAQMIFEMCWSLITHLAALLVSGGSTTSDTSSPTSLSVSEHASTIKSEPNMAPSPYAGQTVTSATQVILLCHTQKSGLLAALLMGDLVGTINTSHDFQHQ